MGWQQAWERGQAARARGDVAEACRWLERARRLAPADPTVALASGVALVEAGALVEGAAVLDRVARGWDAADVWVALAACHLALGMEAPAIEALGRALQARVVDDGLAALATRVVTTFGRPGWCGLAHGRVRTGPGRASRIVRTDGAIEVGSARGAFVGSPLPERRLTAMAGFVEEVRGGLAGWAWFPADPERDPAVFVRGPTLAAQMTLSEPADGVEGLEPAARPRRLSLSMGQCAALGWPLRVTDLDGRDLLGSPVIPLEASAPVVGPPRSTAPRGVDVVIPVYGGGAVTMACLHAVLATVPSGTVVHVIDDASPEPALRQALAGFGDAIRLARQERNSGFPAAANRGIRAAGERDVVLLNSDTVVPPGWLERLRQAAYAAPEIGTATPLSNEATIVSYPDPAGGNPVADGDDALALRANAGLVADIPVGVGFCLYLRRDCLDQVGLFREDVFAQGYGEEVDLCLRARQAGWRHVAALDVVVAHVGGASFGSGRAALQRRNGAILNRLYPGYDALIAAHVATDPLFEARRRMDELRWQEGRAGRSVLLVTHGTGGGVAESVEQRCGVLRAAGVRPIVLRPAPGGAAIAGYPNLRFRVPEEVDALATLLEGDRPDQMEVHHLLGHDHRILALATRLGVPTEHWVHDDAAFCPRIALVDGTRRYCGEPDVAGCEACVAAFGDRLDERIGVRALVARSAAELAGCARMIVPTADGARRMRRHFPGLDPAVVPWEDDAALPPFATRPAGPRVRVCVVGGIGVEKGYDVLLDCVRDAAVRALPLEFVVCGHTEDDARLLAAGPVFVTGPYAAEEAVGLIRAQGADLAFLPSIWPEVWCFALTRAWQAGLPAVAFDLGAQAERIRATGRGWVLPLGLPIPAVNDALLRLARPQAVLQSLQP